jgi:diaminopimelate decarboxylase
MRIDERLVARLRAESGGPVCAYVYDLDGLRTHAARAVADLPAGCELFYAVKANAEAPILAGLAGIVAGFDVGSAGELELVRRAAPGAPVVFGGPGKTDAALAAAARDAGVVAVHVESVHELRRAEYVAAGSGATLPVALRVNLAGPLPVATLVMAGQPTQFGIDEGDVPAALGVLRDCPHLRFAGFHFHCLSNHHDAPAHARLVAGYLERAAGWAAAAGVPVGVVNAGGGIGVDYAAIGRPFDWAGFCRALGSPPVRLRFECGRYLVAPFGAYVAEVLDVKANHGRWFAVVRGGTHHFRLPASWGHSHPFTVIPVEEWRYPFPRPGVRGGPVTVAGELCSPKDILARDVPVAELRAGDLVWFHHAGAYGWSISHHDFLRHPHPRRLFLGAPARTRISG